MQLIKDNAVVADDWQFIPRDHEGDLPAGKLLVPLEQWLALRNDPGENRQLAPWIDSDEEVEPVAEQLLDEPLVAVHFPVFMDGRGFSTGRLLRERYGFQGELRAIGHVIRDQLFYLKRCGFNAFSLRDGTDLKAALDSLEDFSVAYQGATDNPEPLFRRRNGE
jgi:uncharacterized protein (DUF934 family)